MILKFSKSQKVSLYNLTCCPRETMIELTESLWLISSNNYGHSVDVECFRCSSTWITPLVWLVNLCFAMVLLICSQGSAPSSDSELLSMALRYTKSQKENWDYFYWSNKIITVHFDFIHKSVIVLFVACMTPSVTWLSSNFNSLG